MKLEVFAVEELPEITHGDDLGGLLARALAGLSPAEGDILVVTHKVVSKAEGAVRVIEGDEEEFRLALIEAEAKSILRRRAGLVIAETRHGFVCANAGIDRSNAAPGTLILLPEDPDRWAHRIRLRVRHILGVDLPVVISDTFGRAWRNGVVDVAIGVSGLTPVLDLRGTRDWSGRPLEVTEIAIGDELAAAADLVMGKSSGVPAALIRGYSAAMGTGSGQDLVRAPEEDLFR